MAEGSILVTGAAGFIGSHLCERLASEGHQVRAVDVQPMPPNLDVPGVSYFRVDIRDTARLRTILKSTRLVYHLASVHLEVAASAKLFEEVNVSATSKLIVAAAEAGVRRFVHTSSVGIYGHVERPPADESAPKRPLTRYERSKLAGESEALGVAKRVGLDLVVLRPAWVYGPGCPRTVKLLRAVQRRRFFYIGEGRNLRHPLYIADMVDAFLLASSSSAGGAACYIIAGPRAVTVRELADTCARVLGVAAPRVSVPRPLAYGFGLACEILFRPLGKQPPFSRRSLAFFEYDNAFNTSRAQRELGFHADIDLEEGLRRVTNWAGTR